MLNSKGLIDQILGGLGNVSQGGPVQPHGQNAPSDTESQAGAAGAGQGLNSMLGGLSGGGGGIGRSFPGGIGGAAAAGGLAGLLLGSKKGRKFAGKAAKYGGMAVLGALAYNAWQKHQAGQAGAGGAVGRTGMTGEPAAPAGAQPMPLTSVPQTSTAQHADDFAVPDDARFLPAPESEAGEHLALALLQAMIGAAKADGHIDDAERARIYDAIAAADFDADDKAFLFDELKKPLDVDAIAALSKSPEMATEIYTASAVVVGDPNTEERRYLDRLAGRLGLDAALQDEIEKQIADFEESE